MCVTDQADLVDVADDPEGQAVAGARDRLDEIAPNLVGAARASAARRGAGRGLFGGAADTATAQARHDGGVPQPVAADPPALTGRHDADAARGEETRSLDPWMSAAATNLARSRRGTDQCRVLFHD